MLWLTPRESPAWPVPLLVPPDGVLAPSPDFPVPPELEPAVAFWTDIFWRHGGDTVVLHDRNDLAVIWQVLTLPTGPDGEVEARRAEEVTRAATDDLTARLRRLARDSTPLDDEDRVLIALAGGEGSARLAGAWERVRAQRGIADNFREGIERARPWLAKIVEVLEQNDVPPQLAALPFIESGFNPKARSSAGAAGLWQLMPATARDLGLRVDRKVDERLDVMKATRAAAKMLRKNFRMLESWPLAITGYNHGPYGVRRAVESMGTRNIIDLIAGYEKSTWGFASKNFYAEFVAALRLVRQAARQELALGDAEQAAVAVD